MLRFEDRASERRPRSAGVPPAGPAAPLRSRPSRSRGGCRTRSRGSSCRAHPRSRAAPRSRAGAPALARGRRPRSRPRSGRRAAPTIPPLPRWLRNHPGRPPPGPAPRPSPDAPAGSRSRSRLPSSTRRARSGSLRRHPGGRRGRGRASTSTPAPDDWTPRTRGRRTEGPGSLRRPAFGTPDPRSACPTTPDGSGSPSVPRRRSRSGATRRRIGRASASG